MPANTTPRVVRRHDRPATTTEGPDIVGAGRSGPRPGATIWILISVVLIGAMTAVAYSNSFQGAFVLDDYSAILENPQVHHFSWRDLFWSGGLRRVPIATFAFNYSISLRDPTSYHVVNLILHITAAIVLFDLVRNLLLAAALPDRVASASTGLACCVALLWAVHPLQTGAVTYIVQRMEVMMGLAYFLCLAAFVRGCRSDRAWPWYLLSGAAFLVGMGCKESMATAPLALLLLDYLVLGRGDGPMWTHRKWFYAVLLLPIVVVAPVIFRILFVEGQTTAGFNMTEATWYEYLFTQPEVILHYLRLVVTPYDLCFDYGWPVAKVGAGPILAILGAVGLIVAGVVVSRKLPLLGFAILFFFLHLAPTSSFIPIQDLAFEHRMYVPLAAVLGIVVVGGYAVLDRVAGRVGVRAGALAVGVVVTFLTGLTWERNFVWQDPLALHLDTIAKAPDNARAYLHAADELRKDGKTKEAIRILLAADERGLQYAPMLVAMSNLLAEENRFDEAIAFARRGVKALPHWSQAHANLAFVLARSGRTVEVVPALEQAVELAPGSPRLRGELGRALMRAGRFEEAATQFDIALAADPSLTEVADLRRSLAGDGPGGEDPAGVSLTRGRVAWRQGRLEEGLRAYREYLLAHADDASARAEYGSILGDAGRLDDATREIEAAAAAAPDSLGVLRLQANLYMRTNRVAEAMAVLDRALTIDPADAETLFLLATLEDRRGETAAAIGHLRSAVKARPDLVPAHSLLGAIVASQDPALALPHFSTALRHDPRHIGTLVNLAVALAKLGRLDEATSTLERAAEIDPSSELVRRNLATLRSAAATAKP